jgi:NAD(P)-dependent dehydrogenase (short-subunit alcohol dehydrogenase family)
MPETPIVITGASDGIGAAAARQLAGAGEQVVIVGRSAQKTKAAAEAAGVPYFVADFADLSQVRQLAAELNGRYPRIKVLANNAGGIMGARELTKDGFEKTFQVNHLAPFLLTHLLMPALLAGHAAVIQTASTAAKRHGKIDLGRLQNAAGYSPNKAYGAAKLENILFTRELDRRYRDQGLAAVAFHPGIVATNFARDTTSWFRYIYQTPVGRLILVSPEKGAAQLVWLAEGTPGVTWEPGAYYQNKKPAKSADQATDPVLAAGLWDRSAELLGL